MANIICNIWIIISSIFQKNQIYLKTKELDCFSFTSTNAKDLIIEATKLYRTLIDNGGYDETSRAHELRNQIYQIMNEQTMIEAVTKELLKSVDTITYNSKCF